MNCGTFNDLPPLVNYRPSSIATSNITRALATSRSSANLVYAADGNAARPRAIITNRRLDEGKNA
jgi:hypothetical protein